MTETLRQGMSRPPLRLLPLPQAQLPQLPCLHNHGGAEPPSSSNLFLSRVSPKQQVTTCVPASPDRPALMTRGLLTGAFLGHNSVFEETVRAAAGTVASSPLSVSNSTIRAVLAHTSKMQKGMEKPSLLSHGPWRLRLPRLPATVLPPI